MSSFDPHTSVDPSSAGMSPERLHSLSGWLQEQVDSQRLAGASVLVARQGKVVHREAAGLGDVDRNTPFSIDSIVRIYSMTKPVTTVAAMMLFERGCFQLDDPIALYLPEFRTTQVCLNPNTTEGITDNDLTELESPITVRQLMNHTAGLTYSFLHTNAVDEFYRNAGLEFPGADATLEALVSQLADAPLLCQPGSQWNYSVATDVLGRLVEVWSGKTLDLFFQTEIFEPLNMLDTGFHVSRHNHNRFVSMYGPADGSDLSSVGRAKDPYDGPTKPCGVTLLDDAVDSRFLTKPVLFSGGGGLTGSISDYARFCQMLLNHGELDGTRILGRKTVEYMRQNQLPEHRDMAAMGQATWSETSYEGIGFGLGFAVVQDPVKAHIITSEGEYHWGGAASTFFWIDPVEDLFVVFFTQLLPSSTYPLRRELRARVYQALI